VTPPTGFFIIDTRKESDTREGKEIQRIHPYHVHLFLCGILLSCGCTPAVEPVPPSPPEHLIAKYTKTPIRVDGVLDDLAWALAAAYPLEPARDRGASGDVLKDPGEVLLARDDTWFYIGVRFTDSDVVARGKRDQMHHYRLGDVMELFLKPEEAPWYWELYATPAGRKSSFFLPERKKLTERSCGLQVAASVNGTLNDSRDRDSGWTVEMAVPIADLSAPGQPFGPGTRWRILVARYNHNGDLKNPELSSTPQLSQTDFHLLAEYGILMLPAPRIFVNPGRIPAGEEVESPTTSER